jgi:Peptidase family M28
MPRSIETPLARAMGLSLAAALAGAAMLALAAPRQASVPGVEEITARHLEADLRFVASDALEGRATPSRGLDVAALFLATRLERAGVRPAGDTGSYFQKIALRQSRVVPAETTAGLGDRTFAYGDDLLAAPTPGTASGPLVYVGHGYVLRAKKIDAYAGIDVKGKILVAAAGYPDNVSRRDLRGTVGQDYHTPVSYAAAHGATGVVFLPTNETLSSWARTRTAQVERGDTIVERLHGSEPRVPAITASAALTTAIFANESLRPRESIAVSITGKPASAFALTLSKVLRFTVGVTRTEVVTQNVVGAVDGADPALRKEYVAIGAHYDHVGMETGKGDTIFNGADDDGSGTVAVLAIAEALARTTPRPRRSVLFVWHAGEERGLWGSRYFTRYPTVLLRDIVAQLNIDMIGRSRRPGDTDAVNRNLTGPDAIYVIGSTMMSSTLGRVSREANASLYGLTFDYKYDAPDDPERLFYRSDHYEYARQGIPIIFYFDGVHEDYHRVGDSVDKIDFAKMEKVTRTIYATARAVADLPTRPAVDKGLPRQLTEP